MNSLGEYESVIKDFFRSEIFSAASSEKDFEEMEKLFFEKSHTSYEQMDKNIQTGVENGYSVEYQLDLVRQYLSRL